MHTFIANSRTRREHARKLNRLIERILLNDDDSALRELLAMTVNEDLVNLCGRITRRATFLVRQQPAQSQTIIDARDRCIEQVYGHRTPKGWFTAWCDGSSFVGEDAKLSGLGVVLMDAEHRVVAEFGERIGKLPPLSAELTSLEAAVHTAVTHGADRLRVYTDCSALTHLWQEQRNDDRLARLRQSARRLRRLQLYLVPRRFNQRANRLARNSATGTSNPV
jgi:ribonuclease HI